MEMSAKRFAEMAESDLFMREKGLYLFGIVFMSIFLKKTRKTNSNWFRGCKKTRQNVLLNCHIFCVISLDLLLSQSKLVPTNISI